jgi:hypothetical protein
MCQRFIIFLLFFLVGCGKVAEDISRQSNKSIFKTGLFSFDVSTNDANDWSELISTNNISTIYSYYEGLVFDQGFEKIGWVQADIGTQRIASKNIPTVSNFDLKKNVVTSSRYQQGFISIQAVSTANYRIQTEFRKVRPKFDYYSFSHFMSKDTYLFFVSEEVPSMSVSITPHNHVISAVYLNHLKKESYNRDTVIPLTVFYEIISTASITPTLNVSPKNTIKTFQPSRPIFSINSPLFDALLTTVTLSYYSEDYDVFDFIDSTDFATFPESMKVQLKKSVGRYFQSKVKKDEALATGSVTEKLND